MRRKLLIALASLAVVAAALLGIAWWQASSVLAQLHAGRKAAVVRAVEPELHRQPRHVLVAAPKEAKAQTILLIGSDHRWSGGNGARSDTILLVRVEPLRKRIALLSIPRDLYVAIPGHGHDRINEAFHHGGERLLTRVVRDTFGVEIDHFVEVDFHGFQDLVSALGGVWLPVDQRYFNHNVGTYGTDYADIDLQLFTDDAKSVEFYLIDRQISYQTAQSRLYAGGQLRTFPVLTVNDEGTDILLTVLTTQDLRAPLKTSPEGKVIERAKLQTVETLLAVT